MTLTQMFWNLSVLLLLVCVALLLVGVARGDVPSVTEVALVAIALLLAAREPR